MAAPSDIIIIRRVLVNNDNRAFNELVRKYQSPIRRIFLTQTLGDSQLSDDFAQETFIKAYTKLNTFKATAEFSTWLFRIAYNVSYDYFRSHKKTLDIDDPSLHVNKLGKSSDNMAIRTDIMNAMNVLSKDERTCVTLQLMEGKNLEEVTAITSMPLGTVKSHLSRGKTKLAKYLRENGYK